MWFFSKDSYTDSLRKEISRLYEDNKKLIFENKALRNALNAATGGGFYNYSLEENELCKLRSDNEWLTRQLQFYKDKHSENEEIASLRMQLLRDTDTIDEKCEEIKELKKKINENRMLRTLEQYEKDANEDLTKINQLKYKNFELRNTNTTLQQRMSKLEKELLMYKEFFANNEVKVFLKDKEVDVPEYVKEGRIKGVEIK